MAGRGGRPPGRSISELELRHLRLLLEVQGRAQRSERMYDERLEDFVRELRSSGCSTRGIAEALGVGATTVQRWVTNAERRAGEER